MVVNKESLGYLLSPRSVAIVGASANPRKIGGRVWEFIHRGNFAGPIYPVNPGYPKIGEVSCYGSVEDLPEAVELAILAVPAEGVLSVLTSAANRGIKAAIVFAGGFAETSEAGIKRQEELSDLLNKTGLVVLGPNCLGAMNLHASFIGTFISLMEGGRSLQPGPLAYVGQSGAVGSYLLTLLLERGVTMGTLVATGNEVVVQVGDVLQYLADDPAVDVITVYLEGCRTGQRLEAGLARAAQKKKPVIMCKVGKTSVGKRAVGSHTANMVGDDEVYNALFRKYGVFRARDIEEMADVASACCKSFSVRGPAVGVYSASGGVGVMVADECSEKGLSVPLFDAKTSGQIKELVPFAATANPLDPTAQGSNNPKLYEKILDIMVHDPAIDSAIVNMAYTLSNRIKGQATTEAICRVAEKSPVPMFVTGTMSPEIKSALLKHTLCFSDPFRAVATVQALHSINEMRHANQSRRLQPPSAHARNGACEVVIPEPVTEFNVKELLRTFGMQIPRSNIVTDKEDAVSAAEKMGFPVVLKIVADEIRHKTEWGGVLLNLNTQEEVGNGYDAITAKARSAGYERSLRGVAVEAMVNRQDIACEVILGMKRDPVFGPVVMVGLGGILTELLKDYTLFLPPASKTQIFEGFKTLKGYPMLCGYRGRPRADLPALGDAVEAFMRLCMQLPASVEELEINPLAVLQEGKGAVVLDALLNSTFSGAKNI